MSKHEHNTEERDEEIAKLTKERDEARRAARSIRREAGFDLTWPFPWEVEA